jgi:dephospho-CoA kinase
MADSVHIIGIGGTGRSGKDTLANMFIKEGWFGVSFGDITRDYAQKRHANEKYPISRNNLTETSNWLRETRGPDVIMQIAIERYEEARKKGGKYKGLLAYSIRAPIEADFIVSHGGQLIWIDVSDEIRYKRAMNDLREGEPHLSFKEFMAGENTQFKPLPGIPEEIQMNLPYIKSKATRILVNNSNDLNKFLRKAQELIDSFKF